MPNSEDTRIEAMMEHVPVSSQALEIGARDGRVTRHLLQKCESIIALDLERPNWTMPGVSTKQGDLRSLEFEDASIELVVCSEVLEHIPPNDLRRACDELTRVTKEWLLVGVPLDQDTRVGQTTCQACGTVNPPWGHVNEFSKDFLLSLFPSMNVHTIATCGTAHIRTNPLSNGLYKLLHNPRGTYGQEEPCVSCGAQLIKPAAGWRDIAALLPATLTRIQNIVFPNKKPMWIHVLFQKGSSVR